VDDRKTGNQNGDVESRNEVELKGTTFLPAPVRPLYRSEYRGPVAVTTLVFGSISIRLVRPADPDRLLDDPAAIDSNRSDDYMPYWPYLWPSALLLAEWVACEPLPQRPDGPAALQTLEIGCGLGLPGLLAVARGLQVQFTDHDSAPLDFVARSAVENQFDSGQYSIRHLDWRSLPDDRFSIILGADVIYETRLVALVTGLLSRLLAPDGLGVIASPCRAAAQSFPAALADVGLTCQQKLVTTRSLDGQAIEGTIYQVRRPTSLITT